MRSIGRHAVAIVRTAALCALLAACGGGGSGGGLFPSGNGLTPFPTQQTDVLPPGTRIDVSSKNLFQMGSGDNWFYNVLDSSGNPTGSSTTRQVTADDGAGHVSLTDFDGGASTTNYTVGPDGLLDTAPLGTFPASMASIVGAIFEYATPLYPVGAERKHVRGGPYGQDLDGDGKGESFLFQFTQVFVGFETVQLSVYVTLKDVAHFHNVLQLTLRPTAAGNTDYTITSTEDTWFAPGLGMVKAQRKTVDSDGFTLELPHTLLFTAGVVGGVSWNVTVPPPPQLDGSFIDVPLKHNALVYDTLRNVYYASVPGSVIGNGNSIATIDPTTGQVSYSAPVGSEPNALAIAGDASALYVGTDGSGDVVKLALPSMAEQGRTKLPNEPIYGQTHAETIAVSPVDATVIAVSMSSSTVSPRHAGVVLLRDMVIQPNLTQIFSGPNIILFDPSGTKLYGTGDGGGLYRMLVLADGVAVDVSVPTTGSGDLSVLNNRIVVGHALYDALSLDQAGTVSTQSDCKPQRSGSLLMCFDAPVFNSLSARIVLADPDTFVLRASLVFALSEPGGPRRMVEGPDGQVAISYPANIFGFNTNKIRLFTSASLPTPPAPPAPSWPVTGSSTQDGTALDIGLTHNALVYDSGRNVYYASVPGSVLGAGNSIAIIDPATGQVAHSAPIGSEPNALAIAADGSVLYVGLGGSGDVLRLALPSLTPAGRTHLVTGTFGQTHAQTIAVSPADASVAAVSLAFVGVSPQHAGVALLRDMVLQPKLTQAHTGSNLVTFDSAGTSVYGLNTDTTEFGLRHIQVLADGLAEDHVVPAATDFSTRALSFANDRVIAGHAVYAAPALTTLGVISSSTDCWPTRAGTQLLCFGGFSNPGRVLIADPATFVIGSSLLYMPTEPNTPQRLVQGPVDQIAVSYPSVPVIRLFTSAQLP